MDPSPTETVRRGWTLLATPPGTAKAEGQREQRTVDVCLHDVLQQVHMVAPTGGRWLTFANELRARAQWSSVAARVDAAMSVAGTATAKRTRGYFWSSMLMTVLGTKWEAWRGRGGLW